MEEQILVTVVFVRNDLLYNALSPGSKGENSYQHACWISDQSAVGTGRKSSMTWERNNE